MKQPAGRLDRHLPDVRMTGYPPEQGWRRLLEVSANATFFHSLDWIRLYSRHLAGEPLFFLAEAAEGLVGGLAAVRFSRGPFHYVESLPMGTYGGPLVDPSFPQAEALEAALLECFLTLGARPTCLRCQCVIRRPGGVASRPPFSPAPIHMVPLTGGFDHFWMKVFPLNRRNECRRAEKRGVRVVLGDDPAHLEAYHRIHRDAYRRWGLKPIPIGLFRDLIALGPDQVLFFTVLHEERVLGAHLTFVSGPELLVWNGVTVREDSKKFFPASMLVVAEAEEGCRRKLDALNMGASGGLKGIAGFKRLVGGQQDAVYSFERTKTLLKLLRAIRRRRSE